MQPDMKTKILIVEDDPHILLGLEEVLKSEGFEVASCARGDHALDCVTKHKPALIVLDVMLPGLSGYDICKQLRSKKITLPILMLTAKGQEIDKVVGLDLGADDYVTKPFSPRELLARVRTVLRRAKGEALTDTKQKDVRAYRFGSFEINIRTRRLANKQPPRQIDLTNGEFNLLVALVAAPQRILTRDQLLETSRVFENEVYDRSIDVQVLRLRRKIEIDPSHPQLILTERGVGYCFNSPVEVLY
jgi:two-component system OmpR family response regulator